MVILLKSSCLVVACFALLASVVLNTVRWQEFGLDFKDFFSSTGADDPTGSLELLHAVRRPLLLLLWTSSLPLFTLVEPVNVPRGCLTAAITAGFAPWAASMGCVDCDYYSNTQCCLTDNRCLDICCHGCIWCGCGCCCM